MSVRSKVIRKYLSLNLSRFINIVAYLAHARTVEPQKKPLLNNTRTQQQNNGVMQRVSRQRFSKHVPTRNNGNCVSEDESYSSLLESSQRATELAG
jgi:tRNA C32,U32 (ribose-2'-O)-methylase TrmJ